VRRCRASCGRCTSPALDLAPFAHLYASSQVGRPNSHVFYSPAFALAVLVFPRIPFLVFYGLWLGASIGCALWLRAGWLVVFSPSRTERVYASSAAGNG
jgi:hypothetical protein